jgi:hypothetical protein
MIVIVKKFGTYIYRELRLFLKNNHIPMEKEFKLPQVAA